MTDFSVNAVGTLQMLEHFRMYCPEAVFVFTSTNKVYGDTPNLLPVEELETRWELPKTHPFYKGIDESMSLDHCTHSIFGVSKASPISWCRNMEDILSSKQFVSVAVVLREHRIAGQCCMVFWHI